MSTIKWTKEELQAFKVYFSKGCVGLPTAERVANNALRKIEKYLSSEELRYLSTAEWHAKHNEGRGEWDVICLLIKKRLGLK